MGLNPEQVKRHEEIRQVKDQIADEFLSRPDITGVGVGFKEVGGVRTDQLAIVFYVKAKKDVAKDETLPLTVRGIPTDVVELRISTGPLSRSVSEDNTQREVVAPADVDTKKYDPLWGGISIGPSREIKGAYGAGTLGVMGKDSKTKAPMMLSNYHVMCGNDGKAAKGDDICQPSRVDAWLEWCSNCAKLERWYVGDVKLDGTLYGIDAAVAEQSHRGTAFDKIVNIGEIAGVELATAKMLKDKVIKQGRTTGKTTGSLISVSLDVEDDFGPPYNKVKMSNLLLVEPTDFIMEGDSGSILLLEDSLRAIGLLWGIGDGHGQKNLGIACQIMAVTYKLGIDIS